MNDGEPIIRLSRDFGFRVFLSLISLPLLLISIVGLLGFNDFLGPARGVACYILKFVVVEVFAALLVVSVLCLTWAIATPTWVERVMKRYAYVLAGGLLLFIPGFLLFMHCLQII